MKLLKNKKFFSLIIILFFIGYLTVNYVNLYSTNSLSKSLNEHSIDKHNEHEHKHNSDLLKRIKEEKRKFLMKIHNNSEIVRLDENKNEIVVPQGPEGDDLIPVKDEKIIESNNDNNENANIIANSDEGDDTNKKNRFLALDGNGMASVNTELIKCGDGLEVQVVGSSQRDKADFSYYLNSVPDTGYMKNDLALDTRRHYYMVYAMESEPHSGGGESWTNADFKMWYNLDLSFPEPATYFDVKSFLPDLLSPPLVEFEKKESTPIAWILSNCNAFNGREKYVKRLMDKIGVDSFGFCLRNKNTHTSSRMHGNIELYSKYKFVLAIENSNCEDYITEKLVHAVASGSIPIVAGKDGKPDYTRYMPKDSYINIYDYKTVDELVEKLKKIENDKNEYEKYISFKRNHNYTRDYLKSLSLPDLIRTAKKIIDPNEKFFSGLIDKEKSESKLCKIARYLKTTPKRAMHEAIKSNRANRPSTYQACLPSGNLGRDFS